MGLFRRFKADQGGNVAIIFGAAILPIMGMVGAAIDYARASEAHSRMQAAADQASLAIIKLPIDASQAAMNKVAQATIEAAFGAKVGTRTNTGILVEAPTATRDGKKITVKASGSIDLTIMKAFTQKPMDLGAQSTALWNVTKIEMALVLDNTGSMGDSIGGGRRKIDALKSSAKELLAGLQANAKEADTVKVSLVPFDTEVRLDPATYRNERWFRSGTNMNNWTGYVYDRYNGYATSDAAPVTSIPDSLFPAPETSEFASYGSLQMMRPLATLYNYSNYTALTSAIDAMTPRGNTNVALGAMWGLATLSPSSPFTEGQPFGTPNLKKYMIILTDGDNTQGRSNGNKTTDVNLLNQRTAAACQAAKDAGVSVFTIRLVQGNAALLQGCASPVAAANSCYPATSQYFDVQNAAQLSGAFRCILDSISGTRISS